MRLYGNDIDETTTVLEADLGWIVGWNKTEFIGRDVLAAPEGRGRHAEAGRLRDGRSRHRPPRLRRLHDGVKVGVVTSGTQTPFLKKAIGMAYVPPALTAPGTELTIDIRGRMAKAIVVPMPFYKRAEELKQMMRIRARPEVHQGPRVDSASTANRPLSASPTSRSSSSATSSTSNCRRSAPRSTAGQSFGTIESVKAVSELFAPVTGDGRGGEHRAEGPAGGRQQRAARHLDDQVKMNDPGDVAALLGRCRLRRPYATDPLIPLPSRRLPMDTFVRRHIGPRRRRSGGRC